MVMSFNLDIVVSMMIKKAMNLRINSTENLFNED